MKTYRCRGTITVFLSLISILFLSLLCTTMESARIQGARAKAAAALDMGIFSVFGEFENSVLEQYDVFFLDGALGSGSYSENRLEEKLQTYMEYNVSPNKELLWKGFDPFPLALKSVKMTGVAFATDQKGNAFYQQAVGFMHDNLATEAVSVWLERKEEAEKLKKAKEDYEKKESSNASDLEKLQQQQEEEKQRREEEKEEKKEQGEVSQLPAETEHDLQEYPKEKNPLETIKKIQKMGLTGLILGEQEADISDKVLSTDVPSRRKCRQGSLKVEKKYSGLTSNLLFQEYLFERFPCYTDKTDKKEMLDYGLEYILCGGNSDRKNIKNVMKKLLLLREGANFLYLSGTPEKKAQADALASLIVGAIPVPGLQAAVSYALLLVWAYAESLLDVRCLFAGKKVEVWKSQTSWRLDLKNIPALLDWLEAPGKSDSNGLNYEEYLQILFSMGSVSSYSMRALDLLEGHIRKNTENRNFRADQAIVKMTAAAEYDIPPVFLQVSHAFLKTGTKRLHYKVGGTFAY